MRICSKMLQPPILGGSQFHREFCVIYHRIHREIDSVYRPGKPVLYWHSALSLIFSWIVYEVISYSQNLAAHSAIRETQAKIHTQFNLYSSTVHKTVLFSQLHCQRDWVDWELEDRSWSCCQLYFTDEEKVLDNLNNSPKVTQLISGKVSFDVLNRTLATQEKNESFPKWVLCALISCIISI